MKKDDILDSIEYVDSTLIEKAENCTVKKNKAWLKWGALAACLCLVVLGSVVIPKITNKNPASIPAVDDGQTGNSSHAIYTDRIMLPECTDSDSDEVKADMIGCLVYKGHVYTQGASYNDDISAVEHLVGDYIGEAKGTLDEWSMQDDYATEFASTYSGPVYTVKGYDEDFRLCIYVQCGDEKWLQFLDNFDGIRLTTGKDLFDDRFHIKGNVTDVHYLTHYDWDYVGVTEHTYKKLSITDEQFNEFIDVLCESPFERIDYSENPIFYETEVQGHLYLDMNDGTRVELRLMDGGYVGCAELGWFFVRMPGDIFDTVLSSCQ